MTAPGLPAFLLARIAEDEADARKAAEVNPPPWRVHLSRMGGDTGLVMGGETPANRHLDGALWDNEGADSLSMEPATAAHIARHDPARVLAECKAIRAVVELHQPYERVTGYRQGQPIRERLCSSCGGATPDEDPDGNLWLERWNETAPCDTLLALAQVYADHPDFDRSWRV